MRTTLLTLLILLLALAWHSSNAAFAQEPEPLEDSQDAIAENDPPPPPPPGQQPDASKRGRRGRRGPSRPGPGWHGRARRGEPDRPHRGMDRRGKTIDSAEIIEFLQKHEPGLAQTLTDLLESNPQEFRRRLESVRQLYEPVIRQMKRDPEMANLQLKKIRLQLKAKQSVKNVQALSFKEFKDAKTAKQAQTKAKKELRKTVAELFDVIVAQQEKRLTKAEERMKEWEPRGPEGKKGPRPRRRAGKGIMGPGMGKGMGPGMGKGMGPGKGRRGKGRSRGKDFKCEFDERLTEKKARLTAWREHKKQIVNDHVEELLQGREPFPWDKH